MGSSSSSRGFMTGRVSSIPLAAQCLGCRYEVRNLPEDRCPECGRTFDPNDAETLYIPTFRGLLARRFLKRAGLIFYLWPLAAAAWTLVVWQWGSYISLGYESSTGIRLRLPRWTGTAHVGFEMLAVVVLLWFTLLVTWLVRVVARRIVVIDFNLPRDRLTRDLRPRRFAAWCFLLSMLIIGPRTDRCTHGEFWEMWHTFGVEREIVGGFCEFHATTCIPLGRGWHLYWR